MDNLGGWLTRVVARVCLDMLRSRGARREPAGAQAPDVAVSNAGGTDPEYEALLADSIGPALLVVLDSLAPAERLAFALHDLFAMPFDEIAAILDRSPDAAKKLASRARRKVQGAELTSDADAARQREVVDAFLAASRDGDLDALLELLDPDAVVRADSAAVKFGASEEAHGAAVVAESFAARAHSVQAAVIDGLAGAAFVDSGTPRAAFNFTLTDGKVVAIDILADPDTLEKLDIEIIEN